MGLRLCSDLQCISLQLSVVYDIHGSMSEQAPYNVEGGP